MSDPDYLPYLDDNMMRSYGNELFHGDVQAKAYRKASEAYQKAITKAQPYFQSFGMPVQSIGDGIYARGGARGVKGTRKPPKKYSEYTLEEQAIKKARAIKHYKFIKALKKAGDFDTYEADLEEMRTKRPTLAKVVQKEIKNAAQAYQIKRGKVISPEKLMTLRDEIYRKYEYMPPREITRDYMKRYPEGGKMPKGYQVTRWPQLTEPARLKRLKQTKHYYFVKALKKQGLLDEYKAAMKQTKSDPKLDRGFRDEVKKYMDESGASKKDAITHVSDKLGYNPKFYTREVFKKGLKDLEGPPESNTNYLSLPATISAPKTTAAPETTATSETNPVEVAATGLIKMACGGMIPARGAGIKSLIGKVATRVAKKPFWSEARTHAIKLLAANPQIGAKAKNIISSFISNMEPALRKALLSKTSRPTSPFSVSEIVAPLIQDVATKYKVPMEELHPVLEGPLNVSADGGFIDTAFKILTSPITKKIVSKAARFIFPKITKKLSNWGQKKFGIKVPVKGINKAFDKFATPSSSTAVATTSASPATTSTAPITPELPANAPIQTSNLLATASGVGPNTADAFTRGGRIATKVYAAAKKI